MNIDEKHLINMLFSGDAGRFFETVEEDGIRRPAITVIRRKDDGNDEFYEVTIRRRSLNKWLGEGEIRAPIRALYNLDEEEENEKN